MVITGCIISGFTGIKEDGWEEDAIGIVLDNGAVLYPACGNGGEPGSVVFGGGSEPDTVVGKRIRSISGRTCKTWTGIALCLEVDADGYIYFVSDDSEADAGVCFCREPGGVLSEFSVY